MRKTRRLLAAAILALGLWGVTACPVEAQNPEDELGNWLIYNGTVRFSEEWSLFTEAQVRLWEVASNLNETLVRAAGHYNFTPDALVGVGYLRADTWPYGESSRERIEHRIYEQLTLWQNWWRSRIEHRYRLEQRWLDERTATRFSSRARYRFQVTTPLSESSMQPGVFFLNAYNEFFINFDSTRTFDQNRLYGAGGYQFTSLSNLQLGFLWQARSSADFIRLQIFYTHNFDLRGDSDR